MLFLEYVVVLPSVLRGLLVLVLLLVAKVIAEVIVYKQAIVFLLLLVVVVDSGRVEYDIRLLLNWLEYDLFVLIIFEGRLDRPIVGVWLCWFWLDSCRCRFRL